MDAKREAYWWWFDSHNSPKYSPWLRSTLSELDEKAKAMLKLIEEDADSFAQRAEMYYKKRPELISMVEDFYRAYRSLAERYDQQRMDPMTRVRSPLRHSLPDLKAEFRFSSLKSLGSFTDEEAYNSSEESAQSEIDDPEEDHDVVLDDDLEVGLANRFKGEANTCDEFLKLKEELEKLREENEIQRNSIKRKEKETEKMRNEIESVMLENKNLKDEMKKKEEEKTEMGRKLEEAKYELMKAREEMEAENRYLQNVIAEKDEEKREVIRQLSLGMEMLREENQLMKKSIMKDIPKKWGSPDFQIFKGFGNLFSLSPKCSTSVVPV